LVFATIAYYGMDVLFDGGPWWYATWYWLIASVVLGPVLGVAGALIRLPGLVGDTRRPAGAGWCRNADGGAASAAGQPDGSAGAADGLDVGGSGHCVDHPCEWPPQDSGVIVTERSWAITVGVRR
jgi:hypothetical protein